MGCNDGNGLKLIKKKNSSSIALFIYDFLHNGRVRTRPIQKGLLMQFKTKYSKVPWGPNREDTHKKSFFSSRTTKREGGAYPPPLRPRSKKTLFFL